MRKWSVLMVGLFALSVLLVPVHADAEESDSVDPSSDPDPVDERRAAAEARRDDRQRLLEERGADREGAWREQALSRLDRALEERRNALLDRLPDDLRERVGSLVEADGRYEGTFVSFTPDATLGILNDVHRSDVLLFNEVYTPIGSGDEVSVVRGNTFQVESASWALHITDQPTAVMRVTATAADPFLVVLPVGSSYQETSYGIDVTFVDGDKTLNGRFVGTVHPDLEDTATLIIEEATFHLSTERVLLPKVSNLARDALESALLTRHLGAEVTLLDTGTDVFDETVLYHDLDLHVERSDQAHGYTVTVDSEDPTGKTIALTFAQGLIDPRNLVIEHENVDPDRTVSTPILPASSLADVLDPADDGTVAEYWMVEDADGSQLLLSFPHFSVHRVHLGSTIDVVVERPSLILGTIGAVVIVAISTIGLFRRPEAGQ